MKNQNYPIIGMGGLPGQKELRKSDERTDYRLILKQWGGSIVLMTILFLLAVADILIIGPILGYIIGIITFIIIYIYLRFLTYQYEQPIPAMGVIIGLFLLGIWIFVGYAVTDRFWWPIRCEWEPRNKLLFVAFSVLFGLFTALPIYRFAQEVVDPNWSPTVEVRPAEWGILWPWTKPQLPPDMEPEVIETIKAVPRPYQVPTDKGGVKTVTDNLNADRVTPDKTVLTTDGKEVDVKDLIYFVKRAPIIGATFRPWKKDGWKHERWKNVVRVWQVYGVVSANGERTTTEIVVTDLKEALKRLSSAFDDPPTPT